MRFLGVGEVAECPHCGAREVVPDSAEQIDASDAPSGGRARRDRDDPASAPAWTEAAANPPAPQYDADFRGYDTVTVGSLLGRTFGAYFANFVQFTLITLVFNLPVLAYTIWFIRENRGNIDALDDYSTAVQLGSPVFGLMATGAISLGVIEHLRGRKPSMGTSVSAALGRLLPMLGTAIIAGVSIALGSLLFVIPGLIIMCMLWLAVPVCIIEREGPGNSLSRSYQLTAGYKMRIFGFLFVVGLIDMVVGFVLGYSVVSSGTSNALAIVLIGSTVVTVFTSSLRAVGGAVAYHDIIVQREGPNVDELVSIFE